MNFCSLKENDKRKNVDLWERIKSIRNGKYLSK